MPRMAAHTLAPGAGVLCVVEQSKMIVNFLTVIFIAYYILLNSISWWVVADGPVLLPQCGSSWIFFLIFRYLPLKLNGKREDGTVKWKKKVTEQMWETATGTGTGGMGGNI